MVTVENLTKQYSARLALDHVSFRIREGEVVGLIGLNGAGKSTTMNLIAGCLNPTGGSAFIGGFDVVRQPVPAKRLIGYLPENIALYQDMKVREYLDFICDLKRIRPRAARWEHISDVCAHVGVSEVSGRMIRNLSKGYRQRVGFAAALIGHPKVLIMDEPTAGLDPSQILEIRTLITRLAETATVLLSSHILSEIETICGRIIMLHEGRIIADDTVENLTYSICSPGRFTVRVRGDGAGVPDALSGIVPPVTVRRLPSEEPNSSDFAVEQPEREDIRAEVTSALARRGIPLLCAQGRRRTLEEAFISLINSKTHGLGRMVD